MYVLCDKIESESVRNDSNKRGGLKNGKQKKL